MGNAISELNNKNAKTRQISDLSKNATSLLFKRISMEANLASQHRDAILRSIPYIEVDGDMREAMYLYNEHFYDVDIQISQIFVLNVSMFYLTYAKMLTSTIGNDHVSARLLMDTRKKIFDNLEELSLKVSWIYNDQAYKVVINKVRGALTSCTSALWHKHGYKEAIEMYYPMADELNSIRG